MKALLMCCFFFTALGMVGCREDSPAREASNQLKMRTGKDRALEVYDYEDRLRNEAFLEFDSADFVAKNGAPIHQYVLTFKSYLKSAAELIHAKDMLLDYAELAEKFLADYPASQYDFSGREELTAKSQLAREFVPKINKLLEDAD